VTYPAALVRLIDRYLLRELLIPFGYCLAGFLIFWLAFDLFTQLGDFQKLKLSAGEIAQYYCIKAPEILAIALPVAFLLALLYALTNHARYHELTAIRSAGVSLSRLALPYVMVGIALSIALFAIDEFWIPKATEAAEQIMNRQNTVRDSSERRQWEFKQGFYSNRAQRYWFIEAFHLVTHEMVRPHVVWRLPDGSRREIVAQQASWSGTMWVFSNLFLISYSTNAADLPTDQQQFDRLPMPEFSETPELVKNEFKFNKLDAANFKTIRKTQLSIREILEYKRLHPDDRTKRSLLATKLQERLAAPWTCLVVVLIALPFGAAPGRRNVFVGVASSIVICFSYFVLQQLALALGTGGHAPPWVAAWMPNVLFAAAGLAMCSRIR
jgi:lipopolysaccharide export system permease protein